MDTGALGVAASSGSSLLRDPKSELSVMDPCFTFPLVGSARTVSLVLKLKVSLDFSRVCMGDFMEIAGV